MPKIDNMTYKSSHHYFSSVGVRHCCPTTMKDMDCVSPPRTVSRMDAGLGSRIPAADGLSKVLPIHDSRYYLWDSSGSDSIGFLIFGFRVKTL